MWNQRKFGITRGRADVVELYGTTGAAGGIRPDPHAPNPATSREGSQATYISCTTGGGQQHHHHLPHPTPHGACTQEVPLAHPAQHRHHHHHRCPDVSAVQSQPLPYAGGASAAASTASMPLTRGDPTPAMPQQQHHHHHRYPDASAVQSQPLPYAGGASAAASTASMPLMLGDPTPAVAFQQQQQQQLRLELGRKAPWEGPPQKGKAAPLSRWGFVQGGGGDAAVGLSQQLGEAEAAVRRLHGVVDVLCGAVSRLEGEMPRGGGAVAELRREASRLHAAFAERALNAVREAAPRRSPSPPPPLPPAEASPPPEEDPRSGAPDGLPPLTTDPFATPRPCRETLDMQRYLDTLAWGPAGSDAPPVGVAGAGFSQSGGGGVGVATSINGSGSGDVRRAQFLQGVLDGGGGGGVGVGGDDSLEDADADDLPVGGGGGGCFDMFEEM